MSTHYNKLLELLNKCRIQRSEKQELYTHTSIGVGHLAGCFNITDINKFNLLYNKVINENIHPLYLTEKHKKQGPILIDLDFKYKSITPDRILTENDYMVVIKQYVKNIKEFIKLEDDDDLKCYILVKPRPSIVHTENNEYTLKDGYHLIFPNICTEPLIQHLMREKVLLYIKENDSWSHLNLINSIEDVIDKAVIEKNNWLVYGSCKNGYEDNKYSLNKILLCSNFSEVEFDETDISRLSETLSIRRFEADNIFKYTDEYDEDKIRCELTSLTKSSSKNIIVYGKPGDIKLASKLVGILNIKRSESYEDWLNLGFCLHNIDDSLLEEWIGFSKKSYKFKNGECEKMWLKFKNIGYTIASLHKWAKTDNAEKYIEVMLEELDDVLQKSISGLPYDIARAFFELYKYQFRIGSIDYKEWYHFDGTRWKEIQGAYVINNMLNEDMVDAYIRLAMIYGAKGLKLEGSEKDKMFEKQKLAINISSKLRGPFKKQIIDELTNLFKTYDPDFYSKLDENKNLICFKNGVYDLENEVFREGRPEDYITLCTNINYVALDKTDTYKLNKIRTFVEDIQPEENMRSYIYDLFASCLVGTTLDQKFNIWTGSGSNGKSLIISLMMESMGDYAFALPPTVLTQSASDPDKASPTMAKTKGKRFGVLEETESTDQIYVGKMKAYTGGAKIQARKLHKDVIEFYPQFKLILTCNRLPHIPSNDGGTWRRIRLVPFEMKFVDNPNEDHERKINRKLESELRECREEFMSLLVERYKIYKKDGLSVPDKVMSFTESYQSNSDIYLDYINECIDYTNNKEDKMNLQEVITDMQYWLKNIRFEKRTYVRNDMKYELEEKLGKLGKRTFWKGYTLKVNPDLRKKNKLQLEEDGFSENILVVNDDDENIISTMDKIKGSKQKEVKLDI